MVISFSRQITPYEIHLAKTVETALNSISNKSVDVKTNKYAVSILLEFYKNGIVDEYNHQKIMILKQWTQHDTFVVISSKLFFSDDENTYEKQLNAYSKRIDLLFQGSISFVSNGFIISCVCERMLKQKVHILLEDLHDKLNLVFGVSYSFTSIANFVIATRQSTDAIKYRGKLRISYFMDCALLVLVNEQDREYCMQCIHPVVKKLFMDENRNKVDYYKTLRAFLQSERSYVLTAERIFTPINTVFQRISKILDLHQLNLDDPYTREYILFSCCMLDHTAGSKIPL
jgi:intracellular septation protein A